MARALIVIDIQNDYFTGGALPLFEASETEARIVRGIEQARAAGDLVILVQHLSSAATGLFAAGSAGVEIRQDILSAAADAPVVTKRVADAFQDTDLVTHLAGVDELLICGMMTQNCVVFTAMSDAAKDFKVSVIGTLCAAPSEIVHRIALNALASKLNVISATEIW